MHAKVKSTHYIRKDSKMSPPLTPDPIHSLELTTFISFLTDSLFFYTLFYTWLLSINISKIFPY